MKKRNLIVIVLLTILVLIPNTIKAKSITTNNNINIEENLYNKLIKIYSKDFVENMSLEEYQIIAKNDSENINIEVYSYPLISPLGSTHTTSSKSLKIIKNGTFITMELTWLVTANVKAYDVIGVRLSSGLSITNYTFKQYHTVYGARQQLGDCSYKTTSSGLGASFHLGEGTDNLITLSFIVSGSGTIFGAYQHATSSKVTLANSLDYSFSPYGYGNVFKFSSSVANYYDQMSGVDISI